jgi:hypothetical protein
MKIGITLNEVIRKLDLKYLLGVKDNIIKVDNQQEIEFNPDFGETSLAGKEHVYMKTKPIELNKIKKLDIKYDPFNLYEIFGFETLEEYDSFFYHDASFQTLGQVKTTYKKAMNDLNFLNQKIIEDGHNVTLVSQEKDNSKIATLNFLARHGCKANNFKFLTDYSEVWKIFDVIITANPYILKNKPKRSKKKLSIKIASPLNSQYAGDYNFLDLNDFINTYNEASFEEMINHHHGN